MINHCNPAASELRKTVFPLSLSLCLARLLLDTSTYRAASDFPDRGSALCFGGLRLRVGVSLGFGVQGLAVLLCDLGFMA